MPMHEVSHLLRKLSCSIIIQINLLHETSLQVIMHGMVSYMIYIMLL